MLYCFRLRRIAWHCIPLYYSTLHFSEFHHILLHYFVQKTNHVWIQIQGLCLLRRRRFIGISIPIANLRRFSDRLKFIMGILISVRRCLLVNRGLETVVKCRRNSCSCASFCNLLCVFITDKNNEISGAPWRQWYCPDISFFMVVGLFYWSFNRTAANITMTT